MEEVFYTCPYCFSQVSVLVDPSLAVQSYIEDCERCCNPIEFEVHCAHGAVQDIQAEPIGQ